MQIEKFKNSFAVFVPAPHRFTDYLRLCFILPLNDRSATCAAMVESLSKHGTESYPSRLALMRALEEHYGMLVSIDTYRKGDLLVLKASLTSPDARRIPHENNWRHRFLRLFCEILTRPNTPGGRFPEDIFQLEKSNHIRYLESLVNNRAAYSRHRFEQHLFAGEPAATHPDGSVSACRQLTQSQMLAFLREVWRNAPLLIFAHGHLQPQELQQELSPLLTQRKSPVEKTFIRDARAEPLCVTEKLRGLEQAHIWVGFRAKVGFCDPLIEALALGVEIYGSSVMGRLFRRVREQMGLAYDASASYIRTKGVAVAGACVHPKHHKKAIEAILAEFEDLRRGNIEREEFEVSRRLLLERLRASLDSAGFLADFYTTTLLFGGMDYLMRNDLKAIMGRIEKMGREEVAEALSRFRPDTIYTLAPEGGG